MRSTRRPNPGFEAHAVRRRASLASGRGGIRTHVGVSPHDFQSCALSHSATRPNKFGHYHLQGTAERSTAGLTAKKHTDAKSEGTHPDERSEAEGLGIQNEMPDRQEYRPPKTRDRIRNRGPRQRPDGGAHAKHRNLHLAFRMPAGDRARCDYTGWDSQPRSGASRPEGEVRRRSLRNLNPGFESQPLRGGLCPQRRGWDSNPRDPFGSTP